MSFESEDEEVPGLAESWRIFITHVRPRRLIREDDGVKGPLWFASEPTSRLHIFANLLRLFFAIVLNPIYIFMVHPPKSANDHLPKRLLWAIEEANTPDAGLLVSPSSVVKQGEGHVPRKGKYEVTNSRPQWLLRVEFRGTEIISQTQVRNAWDRRTGNEAKLNDTKTGNFKTLQDEIRQSGYIAISYAMSSAEILIPDSGYRLDSQVETLPNGKRKYSIRDRQTVALALLDEYARARTTILGSQDGVEFIWLDEFCLSDEKLQDEQEIRRERDTELGRLADIFRLARRVVVFCHVEDCDHTTIDCPWGTRLFTMGEILNTPEVLQMTRTRQLGDQETLSSYIKVMPGSEFRSYMQAHATENEKWHLYNIMQHATNSGAVPWQSAIHSLIVEAIRRDDTDKFYDHKFLGRALNGLLPRRSQLQDLRGVNGWADLAWLLELNQGYYNATLLAAVCKLADDDAEQYSWWGKPIAPKEGTERLEALVHAIPVTLRKSPDYSDGPPPENPEAEPALSIIGPKSIALSHWLQRDHTGLYGRPEMKSLRRWVTGVYVILNIGFIVLMSFGYHALGLFLVYLGSIAYTILELLVGTMFIREDEWVVVENRVAGDADGAVYRWLKTQDPVFDDIADWGDRQMVPNWDPRDDAAGPVLNNLRPVTLIHLRNRVIVGAVVSKRPNSMIALAVHGSGITCMLLRRSKQLNKTTTAHKVGMANLPPFVLAQAEESGTIYICSQKEEKHKKISKLKAYLSLSGRSSSPDPSVKTDASVDLIALKRLMGGNNGDKDGYDF